MQTMDASPSAAVAATRAQQQSAALLRLQRSLTDMPAALIDMAPPSNNPSGRSSKPSGAVMSSRSPAAAASETPHEHGNGRAKAQTAAATAAAVSNPVAPAAASAAAAPFFPLLRQAQRQSQPQLLQPHEPQLAPSYSAASLPSSGPLQPPGRYHRVSTRLYADPQARRALALSHPGLLVPVPFVPRPLSPVAGASHDFGPLVSQWLAMLAWELSGGGEEQQRKLRQMDTMLAEQCARHEQLMRVEREREEQRVRVRALVQEQRRNRHALAAEADAANTDLATGIQRRRPAPRFGGVLATALQSDLAAEDGGPDTTVMPQQHAAFVCDTLDKVAGETGRIAPVLRRVVRTLFHAVYQGFQCKDEEGTQHALLLRQAGTAVQSAAAAAARPSGLVIPYSRLSQLLNEEFHRGQSLIDSYLDAQSAMHVQSLRRADVLAGASRRLQLTVSFNVFVRWRFVAQQRRRQLEAHRKLLRKFLTHPQHLQLHFLRWRRLVMRARLDKNQARHDEAAGQAAALQVACVEARKSCAGEAERLRIAQNTAVQLSREVADTRRQLHHTQLQSAAFSGTDQSIHRLLDGSFELLRAALDSLATELEMARGADLQDPLRMLSPSRTSWHWDVVYHDSEPGSAAWAALRNKELEAARSFFDGSAVVHESKLAHTRASITRSQQEAAKQGAENARRRRGTAAAGSFGPNGVAGSDAAAAAAAAASAAATTAAATAAASTNFAQEVELILLWVNFHLVQSQNKILVQKQERVHARAEERKRRAAADAAAAAARKHRRGKSSISRSGLDSAAAASVEDGGDADPDVDADAEMDWFDGSAPVKLSELRASAAAVSDARNKRNRSHMQQGRASLSANLLLSAAMPSSSPHASAGEADSDASNESSLKSHAHFLAQFTSSDALARRADNFTSSLQDSELLLRLLGEIAPQVADTEMLMHVDLQSRARLLIRMLEKLDPSLATMVTPLDFVHAFSSDRVAALLARLCIAHPQLPCQGEWFDSADYRNRTRKPFLRATDPARLAAQMESTSSVAGSEGADGDFGPLQQLHHELVQLQHATSARHRISVACIHELTAAVKRTVAAGRRILDDAHARHDLWMATRRRLKGFVTAVLVAHVRGRPLKLDDPRALAERQSFCALVESPMHALLQKQRERLDASARALQTSVALASSSSAAATFASLAESQRRAGQMLTAMDSFRAADAMSPLGERERDELERLTFPFGRPQQRFMDLLSPENRTQERGEMAVAAAAAPVATAEPQTDAHAAALVTVEDESAALAGARSESALSHASAGSGSAATASALATPHFSRPSSSAVTAAVAAASASNAGFGSVASSRRSSMSTLLDPDARGGAPVPPSQPDIGAASATATATAVSPSSSLPHILSFELHVIQNLLHVFYEPLKQIWRAYAQADAGQAAQLGSGAGGSGGASAANSGSIGSLTGSNTMNLLEYWQLIRDCGLCSASTLTTKQAEQVFLEVFMSRREKRNKEATAGRGDLALLTALVFDAAGAPLPPKDKERLELTERDFVEVLVRLAFLRKIRRDERAQILAEWRGFQAQRREEMRRERDRRRAAAAARRRTCGGDGEDATNDTDAFDFDDDADADPDAAAGDDLDPDDTLSAEALAALNPLSGTLTGERSLMHARLFEGMDTGAGTGAGGAGAAGAVDETFGVDLSEEAAAADRVHLGLSLRFFGLLKLRVLPHASKLDADSFRAQYKTPSVSKLFRRHGAALRRLFFRYATLHSVAVSALDGATADSWSNTIDYGEFVTLLRDLHLLAEGAATTGGGGGKEASKTLLSHEQCFSIFANVQQELHVANANVTSKEVPKQQPWAPSLPSAVAAEAEKNKSGAAAKRHLRRKTGSRMSINMTAAAAQAVTAGSGKKKERRASQMVRSGGGGGSTSSLGGGSSGSLSTLPAVTADASSDSEAAPTDDGAASTNAAAAADNAADAAVAASASADADLDSVLPTVRNFSRTPSPAGRDASPGASAESDEVGAGAVAGAGSHVRSPSDIVDLDGGSGSSGSMFHSVTEATATHLASQSLANSSSSEMIYPEYLEALAAIACFRYPNPYKSTAEKIEAFLDADVLPHISKLLKRQQHARHASLVHAEDSTKA